MTNKETSLQQSTVDKIINFTEERNWDQFHNPKDLAISISLEASELLEVYQWSGIDNICAAKKDEVADELSDIIIYCVLLADKYNLDIDKIVNDKLVKNNIKYPVSKSFGKNTKYTEL